MSKNRGEQRLILLLSTQLSQNDALNPLYCLFESRNGRGLEISIEFF